MSILRITNGRVLDPTNRIDEVTDLWLRFAGPDITGVTVLTRSPRDMSVIQIACELRPLDLVDPLRYARNGYPHEVRARLRADAPVIRVEPPDHKPFWAITKHADIIHIASQPLRFSSAQGITQCG